MTAAIAVLLVVATAGELFGTLTVWTTYHRGARVAEQFRDELREEEQGDEGMGAVKRAMFAGDAIMAAYRVDAVEKRFRDARRRVAEQLARNSVTTAGLWAFVMGALSGLAAGLVALYR